METYLGDLGHRTNPRKSAPQAPANLASASDVNPHTFIWIPSTMARPFLAERVYRLRDGVHLVIGKLGEHRQADARLRGALGGGKRALPVSQAREAALEVQRQGIDEVRAGCVDRPGRDAVQGGRRFPGP